MTTRIKDLKGYILDKRHHALRRTPQELGIDKLPYKFADCSVEPLRRSTTLLEKLIACELPVILPGEKIVVTRTISAIPDIFTDLEWDVIKKEHYLHERGTLSNLSADYETILTMGLGGRRREIEERIARGTDEKGNAMLDSMLKCIDLTLELIDKYEKYALGQGEGEIAMTLCAIREDRPATFRQALQLLRILHFMLWESGTYHNTLGRLDQYMYPFLRADIDKGTISRDEAYELLMEFFLSANKDSDIYPGMQQGDNGQSIVLGGRDMDGNYMFNELSEMCLEASCELCLIDPKINLRVDKNTPLRIFELGSRLTKKGLGFPQYSNDDIVIPGLIRNGYSAEDAHQYVVAACWEFIIPKWGMDIPNIDALSFTEIVRNSVKELGRFENYGDYYRYIETKINERIDAICEGHRNLYIAPAPYMSLLMGGTVENARDISEGCRYNNYGIHGTGIATAADSLAAIKKYHFEEKTVDAETFAISIDNDFTGYQEIYEMLRSESPKMGQDDDYVDSIATALLSSFDKALQGRRNERGGIYRAGTGTAMYYIGHSSSLGATPDGRRAGEVIPANYSPSLFIKQNGPVSTIKSFTKPYLVKTINGGPLTLEFDDSVFRNEENITKLAMLVRSFIVLGGHQLQLNTVNREKLLDAKLHPELYRNLIVRVWGWSGYFVELDEVYQDHVINRIEFSL